MLLERERELAELGEAIDDARGGSGRMVAIEAQAGLGKTRLLQAAREAGAEAGLTVLVARATELERDFPFALVRQLFEQQLLALPVAERDRLFEGAEGARSALGMASNGTGAEQPMDSFAVLHGLYWVTAALAERQPLLLAIDDAHWSDAASLDYLGFLLPRLEELPLLMVVTSRPDEPGAAASLPRIVTDTLARRLTPAALSSEAASALLAAELGRQPAPEFATSCHEVSGGNPFLLCELVRTLAAQQIDPGDAQVEQIRDLAPERVTRTVLVRLGRLSQQAQAVARALVVLGDDSDQRLVGLLAGLDPQATLAGADALRGSAILDPQSSLRFIHPLVRNAVYSDLPAGELAAAHARAAALLRERGASPEQVATHLVASEPCGERATVEALLGVGTHALASGAPHSACAYLMRALREPAPSDLRAAVLEPLITAGIRGADDSVRAAIESDVFDELERDSALRVRWAPRLTAWMLLSGRFDEAIAMLERAIEEALDQGANERAYRLEAQLNLIVQRPLGEFRVRLERYREHIEPDTENGRLAAGFDAHWATIDGSAAEAAELARRALDHEGLVFDENPTLFVGLGAVLVLIGADALEDARRGAEWALAMARRRGGTPDLAAAWSLSGSVALACGNLSGAEADLRQAIDTAGLSGLAVAAPSFAALLARVLIERGELDLAQAELERIGVAAGEVPDGVLFALPLLVRGHLCLAQGRVEEAAADLLELQARAERWGLGGSALAPLGAYAARALAVLGRHEQARELAQAELRVAHRWGAPTAIARALRALAASTPTTALELLGEAASVLEGSPARLERAHALGEWGATLRRANHRSEAREPLREALELARRCGAVRLAKRTHEELLASGEKVRRYTPIGADSLTPSERRVAELAASGLTNRQIAQDLFLTVKTIETHLSASYDKLGIRSRQQLADALGA